MTHGKAPTATRSTLVISAHAGDFVWRAGTPPVFFSEPHQPELCDVTPQVTGELA